MSSRNPVDQAEAQERREGPEGAHYDYFDFDVVIVGGGPGGLSTAIHLQRRTPDLFSLLGREPRVLVLEKERHPRHKLCGGGLTPISQALLGPDHLGLDIELPVRAANELHLRFRGITVRFRAPDIVKVIHREEFDAALATEARKRGVQLREGVAVTAVTPLQPEPGAGGQNAGVIVSTSDGTLRARAVVGADGAKGVVRRHMGLPKDEAHRVCRLIEVLTPQDPASTPEFRRRYLVMDFSCITEGVQGYVWDFPSQVGDQAYMNRGVFDSRVHPNYPNADLKGVFSRYLARRGMKLEEYELKGNPGHWFDPEATFSAPHVLLAGDAAGIEPLLSDGISCALWYGEVAAEEIVQAFAANDFSFVGYRERILSHPLGQYMAQRTAQARALYGTRTLGKLYAFFLALKLRTMRRGGSIF